MARVPETEVPEVAERILAEGGAAISQARREELIAILTNLLAGIRMWYDPGREDRRQESMGR